MPACPRSLCSRFTRPRPVAWLFFLSGFALMMVFGSWQLERLAWKNDLLSRIARSAEAAPVTALPADDAALAALEFHTAELKGQYLPEHVFHVTPRYWRNQLGYQLFTPFRLEDGRIVLVNRGWVGAKQKDPETRPGSEPDEAQTTVTGLIRLNADRSRFTPISQPEKNLWFARDIALMAEHAGLGEVLPLSIDRVGEQDAAQLPVPSDGQVRLRNDHLQYAITWFAIGFGMLVIFLVYHYKGRQA